MLATHDVTFRKNTQPANGISSQDVTIQALQRSMALLPSHQLEALEDEIDFYAFTGLLGDLMREVLSSTPENEAAPIPIVLANRDNEAANHVDEPLQYAC